MSSKTQGIIDLIDSTLEEIDAAKAKVPTVTDLFGEDDPTLTDSQLNLIMRHHSDRHVRTFDNEPSIKPDNEFGRVYMTESAYDLISRNIRRSARMPITDDPPDVVDPTFPNYQVFSEMPFHPIHEI